MLRRMGVVVLGFAAAGLSAQFASAQNTGGVFPPTVNEGHQSLQYRITLSEDDKSAQRVHYQEAISDDFMWRIAGQVKSNDGDTDFDYLQGELFWDFSDKGDNWEQGLRFDFRLRDEDRPEQFGINWMHQIKASNRLTLRAVALSSVQFGSNAPDGVAIQTRGSFIYKANNSVNVGAELYNVHGTTKNFTLLNKSQRQLGPFVSFPVRDKTSIYLSGLFGLSKRAPDTELRLWLTQGF